MTLENHTYVKSLENLILKKLIILSHVKIDIQNFLMRRDVKILMHDGFYRF